MNLCAEEKRDLLNRLADSPLFSQSRKHSDLQPVAGTPQSAICAVNTGGYNGLKNYMGIAKPQLLAQLERVENKVRERERGWRDWRTTDEVTYLPWID
jgi:hypothetical protein